MRGIGVGAATVLVVLALTGCSGIATQSGQCVDWVAFDTPAKAAADAAVVAIARVQQRTDDTELYGEKAHVWDVAVDRVLHGDGIAAGDRVDVASTPETCSGSAYPQGDPFETISSAESVVLLLDRDPGGQWRTITPWQGVVPAVGNGMPDVWPPGTMGSPAASPQS